MVWWTGDETSRPNNCHIFLARYLRKLDQELHKFQLELEADNRGITEVQNNIEIGALIHQILTQIISVKSESFHDFLSKNLSFRAQILDNFFPFDKSAYLEHTLHITKHEYSPPSDMHIVKLR